MAIYHHSATVIKRSSGKSAVAAAAYRAGEELEDLRTGLTHNYTKKSGVDYSEIITPDILTIADSWLTDRAELWNKVEATEKRYDSQLAREINIAIPTELDRDTQIALVREYVKTNYVNRGMVADVNFHDLESSNPHVHIMLTMRDLIITNGQVEFGNKNRDWNRKDLLIEQRKSWEVLTNQYLAKAGHGNVKIDCRRLEEQGIERLPQIHLGVNVTAMRAKGIPTDRGDRYDQIAVANEQIRADLERAYREDVTAKARAKKQEQLAANRKMLSDGDPRNHIRNLLEKIETNDPTAQQLIKTLRTPVEEISLHKLIGDDQVKRVVEWASQTLIKDGELEVKVRSGVRPVEILGRCKQPNSTSIDFVFIDLTTNEQLKISCQKSSGTVESITGSMTSLITAQIAAINDVVLKGELTKAPISASEAKTPAAVVTAQVEPSSSIVTPKSITTSDQYLALADFNKRLQEAAYGREREARLDYLKQIKDLNALPKKSITNWHGLSETELAARKVSIDQEYQRRLEEIKRILAANLKPLSTVTPPEIGKVEVVTPVLVTDPEPSTVTPTEIEKVEVVTPTLTINPPEIDRSGRVTESEKEEVKKISSRPSAKSKDRGGR